MQAAKPTRVVRLAAGIVIALVVALIGYNVYVHGFTGAQRLPDWARVLPEDPAQANTAFDQSVSAHFNGTPSAAMTQELLHAGFEAVPPLGVVSSYQRTERVKMCEARRVVTWTDHRGEVALAHGQYIYTCP